MASLLLRKKCVVEGTLPLTNFGQGPLSLSSNSLFVKLGYLFWLAHLRYVSIKKLNSETSLCLHFL